MTKRQRLADAVQTRRGELDLSQLELAELSGVSRGTVRNIEAGAVDPNPHTWQSVEGILGWAPGSLEQFDRSRIPIEVLPAEQMQLLLTILVNLLTAWKNADNHTRNNFGVPDPRPIARQFRRIMSSPAVNGQFTSDTFTQLTDFIYNVPIFTSDGEVPDDVDEIRDNLIDNITSAAGVIEVPTPREPSKVTIDGVDVTKNVRIDPRTREKVRQAIMAQSTGQFSDEVNEVLSTGQVIDYGTYDPEDSENLTVAVFLIKKNRGPLANSDRKYVANVWVNINGLFEPEPADEKTEDDENFDLLKPDGVPDWPSPKAAKDDPWASAGAPRRKPSKPEQPSTSYDEPPF